MLLLTTPDGLGHRDSGYQEVAAGQCHAGGHNTSEYTVVKFYAWLMN